MYCQGWVEITVRVMVMVCRQRARVGGGEEEAVLGVE